ncbi:MAG TPA: DNA methylase, partial [Firmicutes bacterium]|nr:DNA methylase [Bacillota bacterium]
NPGDIVFSPFVGIGSEGYQAIKMNRRFVGIELKGSYYKTAVNNLRMAVQESFDDLLG